MKQVLTLFFIVLNSFYALQAQLPRMNRESNIDTLRMSISFSDSIKTDLQSEFMNTFQQTIQDFNQQSGNQFMVILDSSHAGDFVHIDVGEIKYSTTGRSIWVTVLDLGLLAADVALLTVGWPPIFLPILTPAVRSKIQLDMSESVVDKKNNFDRLPLPSGYFVGIEVQNERLNRKIGQNVERLLRKLNKQQMKNSF